MFSLNTDHKQSLENYNEMLKAAEQERLANRVEKAGHNRFSLPGWSRLGNLFRVRRQGYATPSSRTSRVRP